MILLDTDIPSGEDWIPRIRETLKSINRFPQILCTGNTADPRVLSQLGDAFFTGYLLKEEISKFSCLGNFTRRKWQLGHYGQYSSAGIIY